jgi:hypothetical protein
MAASYFFIASPLQYLCAVEAQAQFRRHFAASHLIVTANLKTIRRQLQAIVDYELWTSISSFPGTTRRPSRFNRRDLVADIVHRKAYVRDHLSKITREDFVFVGNIGDFQDRWILRKTKSQHRVILDDGANTLAFVARAGRNNRPRIPRKGVLLYWLLMGWREPRREDLTFYSIYEGVDYSPSAFVPNTFEMMRQGQLCPDAIVGKKTYFIGQPLPDAGVVSMATYGDIVHRAREGCLQTGGEFEYCAHRTESIETYPREWNARHLSVPVECFLMTSPELPAKVVGCYSSALFNIQALFRGAIETIFVRLPGDDISPEHRVAIEAVYAYAETRRANGVRVIRAT